MNNPDKVHVIPTWEEHEDNVDCWCSPYLTWKDPDTFGEVWVHRRGDN